MAIRDFKSAHSNTRGHSNLLNEAIGIVKARKYAEIDWTAEPADAIEQKVRLAFMRRQGTTRVAQMIMEMHSKDEEAAPDVWAWYDDRTARRRTEREAQERYKVECAVAETLGTQRPNKPFERPWREVCDDILGVTEETKRPEHGFCLQSVAKLPERDDDEPNDGVELECALGHRWLTEGRVDRQTRTALFLAEDNVCPSCGGANLPGSSCKPSPG
jgi:hypothetical protein